ncbi:factor-independent urate hydroxylase [Alkalicoccus urumqiensis]|uniref:Uricase n=1 Tax=Alkalicoccus urumqiensis TaxID=1548213 RepID=A0A2P6MLL8_ALKUR|nr:urate oxidase [Alkalicoccus urumqiensis]PRO67174.1 urate oxidase [Alkalicoccus urumqiensis]
MMKTAARTARTMHYGKGDVFVYRTYAPKLTVPPIPESSFTGRTNTIFAIDANVALEGEAFLPSFTDGDNSMVVATDSMKNFMLHQAGECEKATMEGYFLHTGRAFLSAYSHIEGVTLGGRQKLFREVEAGGEPSDVVFEEGLLGRPYAEVKLGRDAEGGAVIEDFCGGITDLHLIKVKGSSFAGFIRDEYTTLPETSDRPLYIYLDIFWRYENPEDAEKAYVPAEQVQGIAQTVFHEKHSPSIQKLIYDIGCRTLERFPQLKEVSFTSNNRTWETIRESVADAGEGQVFTEPRPPYGYQGFTVLREDVEASRHER